MHAPKVAPVLYEQSEYSLKYSDREIKLSFHLVNIILYIQTYFSNIEFSKQMHDAKK